jgi:hypothetical protein
VRWLLISYFDASSKALDYQSKNPGRTLVRVANLTREALLTGRLVKVGSGGRFRCLSGGSAKASTGDRVGPGFYNAPSMQATV